MTDIKKIKAGTYIKICNEFNKLNFNIVLNNNSSFKFPMREKIKKIIKLDKKQIKKDKQ